jgi:hypothetical protein
MNNMEYPIFDLNLESFERLCYDLLNAENNYDKIYFLTDEKGAGLKADIVAIKGMEKIAIEVKHKKQIRRTDLLEDINRLKGLLEYHHKLIYITSASLTNESYEDIQDSRIQIIDQKKLFQLLDRHPMLASGYFKNVKAKRETKASLLKSSIIGIIISVAAGLASTTSLIGEKNKPLEGRIQNVEVALNNIKDLEKSLSTIKEDMIATEMKNREITEEYEKLKGVEAIIKEKKESLDSILNYKPWYKIVIDYIIGFLLGVFTSIIGSIVYDKWRLRKSLE